MRVKRARWLWAALGCAVVWVALGLCGGGLAESDRQGFVITAGPEETADLREGPTEESELILSYYGGVIFECLDAADESGWALIHINADLERHTIGAVGFMRQEHLILSTDRERYYAAQKSISPLERARVHATDGEKSAPLWADALCDSQDERDVYDGAYVTLLGVRDGLYHVSFGAAGGFMNEANLEKIGRDRAPVIAYAVLDPRRGGGQWMRTMPGRNHDDANGYELIRSRRRVEVLSVSDTETQVRY